MIPDTNWEPTPSDIAWQQNMVRILKNGATWAVPGSLSIFEINKTGMEFKLLAGDPNEETNRRIAKVFKLLGFSEHQPPRKTFDPSLN